ncbi:facilitated trehalose transporter Tret1-like [Achroia grisella]|uniref:facilitated trehalose transporter Tret1-like n=1 Tax=Achroia grisella TaxID=688607 RepID=UPI0027D21CD6|nr:facilitated trehalose transporter Tret1-like [Achroia grisella]
MELGLIIGFTAVLIPQLRDDTYMGMDKNAESWIASIQGFSFMLAAFVSPCVIDQYGRRKANFIGAIIVAIGWFFLIVSGNLTMIIIARILQGLALGISSLSGAVLVAEYTSPKYRGAFITLTTITMLSGSLIVHALGYFLLWHQVAIFCLCVAILDGVLVFLSPESPVFLATQGRFDECKKVFHWLRDLDEDEELDAMIKVQILRRAAMNEPQKTILNKFTVKIKSALITIKKADFYKPLIVMMHFNIISVWCGAVMMDAYGFDVFQKLVGGSEDEILQNGKNFSLPAIRFTSTYFLLGVNLHGDPSVPEASGYLKTHTY